MRCFGEVRRHGQGGSGGGGGGGYERHISSLNLALHAGIVRRVFATALSMAPALQCKIAIQCVGAVREGVVDLLLPGSTPILDGAYACVRICV